MPAYLFQHVLLDADWNVKLCGYSHVKDLATSVLTNAVSPLQLGGRGAVRDTSEAAGGGAYRAPELAVAALRDDDDDIAGSPAAGNYFSFNLLLSRISHSILSYLLSRRLRAWRVIMAAFFERAALGWAYCESNRGQARIR